VLRNFDIDAAVSLASSANGTAVSVMKQFEGFSLQAVISSASSLNGTLKLQAAIDSATTPTNWADIGGTTAAVTADGVTMWSIGRHHFKWVRIVYTRTAGSGTMTTTINENI
jgi:hypothetical protein